SLHSSHSVYFETLFSLVSKHTQIYLPNEHLFLPSFTEKSITLATVITSSLHLAQKKRTHCVRSR
ncbi:hypothetical protein, partial [Pseudoalteromonas phenolica]|uniref:hypothetical protein n=1 Tax=Pseudoalteromonas phenolica TaxID=161398 RepID=UPI00198122B0